MNMQVEGAPRWPILRTQKPVLRVFLGYLQNGVAQLQLNVANATRGFCEPEHLDRAKNRFVELDGLRGPLHSQIRKDFLDRSGR